MTTHAAPSIVLTKRQTLLLQLINLILIKIYTQDEGYPNHFSYRKRSYVHRCIWLKNRKMKNQTFIYNMDKKMTFPLSPTSKIFLQLARISDVPSGLPVVYVWKYETKLLRKKSFSSFSRGGFVYSSQEESGSSQAKDPLRYRCVHHRLVSSQYVSLTTFPNVPQNRCKMQSQLCSSQWSDFPLKWKHNNS